MGRPLMHTRPAHTLQLLLHLTAPPRIHTTLPPLLWPCSLPNPPHCTHALTLSSLLPAPAAISMWTSTGDLDHIWIVGSYFHYSVPGGFAAPQAKEITLQQGPFGQRGDPMYVVYARKQA